MPSEWAIQQTEKIIDTVNANSRFPLIAEALDAARKQGRLEGLEECASLINSEAQRLGRLVLDTDDEFDVASAKLLAVVEVIRARFPRCHDGE